MFQDPTVIIAVYKEMLRKVLDRPQIILEIT